MQNTACLPTTWLNTTNWTCPEGPGDGGGRGERSAELDRRCGGSGRERSWWPSSSCFWPSWPWRFAAVPLLNRYVLYDPTADGDNYLGSLELEVAVLESLHFPEWSSQTVYAQETGLGSYDLTLYESDLAAGEWTATKGTMDLADIRFEEDFYRRWVAINQFTRGTYPYYATEQVPGHSPEETAAALAELPDLLDATLSLSFARDLSMEEFAGLAGRYPDLRFQWVGVRINDGERRQLLPLAGFDAAGLSMLGAEEDEERYPFLWLPLHRRTATWERSIPGTSWPCSGTRRSGRSWRKRSGGAGGELLPGRLALCGGERRIHLRRLRLRPAGNAGRPVRRGGSRVGSGSNPSGFQRALRVECGETSGAGTLSLRPSLLQRRWRRKKPSEKVVGGEAHPPCAADFGWDG